MIMKSLLSKILIVFGLLLMVYIPTASAAYYDNMDNILDNGLGGSAGFGENNLGRNDDGSTGLLSLTITAFPSGLNFFGTTYTGLYVNNNGNVTFGGPMSTYTPFGLNQPLTPPVTAIIAPYFADVDTRYSGTVTASPGGNSTGSNLVYYDHYFDGTTSAFIVTWDDVGYYSYHVDKINAFQLHLVNRYDTGVGNFDIYFVYEYIDWTEGDVSDTAARAGYNSGNAENHYEMPASGNEADLLILETTSSAYSHVSYNFTEGVWLFQVRDGGVLPPETPEPDALAILFCVVIAGLVRRKFRNPILSKS